MGNILRAEPALFINVAASIVALLIGGGLISQANGDGIMQVAGVLIPAALTILSGFLTRQSVVAPDTHEQAVADAFEAGAASGNDAAR